MLNGGKCSLVSGQQSAPPQPLPTRGGARGGVDVIALQSLNRYAVIVDQDPFSGSTALS